MYIYIHICMCATIHRWQEHRYEHARKDDALGSLAGLWESLGGHFEIVVGVLGRFFAISVASLGGLWTFLGPLSRVLTRQGFRTSRTHVTEILVQGKRFCQRFPDGRWPK